MPFLQQDEDAIYELHLNGATRQDAIRALKACGGDREASLMWLLQRQLGAPGAQDPEAVAELLANGLSEEDARAALEQRGGDVAQVRGSQQPLLPGHGGASGGWGVRGCSRLAFFCGLARFTRQLPGSCCRDA